MSVRSKFESEFGSGYEKAVSRLRAGASRLRAERSREANEAANLERAGPCTGAGNAASAKNEAEKPVLQAWPLPGLAPMTRVRTNFGDVHAAALRKGDEVLTRAGEYLPIMWLTRLCLDERILSEKPDCNPVVLAAGALGPQVPSREIMLSPRQVVIADARNGLERDDEAARLTARPGIRRLRETSLSYTMFHVGQPAEIYCEGIFLLFPMDA